MSKSARKIRPLKRHIKSPPKESISPEKAQKTKLVIILLSILVLAGTPFVMGKYCEFNTPDPYDSGAYVYSAEHILDGARIGVEEMPTAQLGTLSLNMLGVQFFGFNETGPKLIQTIFQAGALFMMFVALLQLYGVLPAAIGVIIASVYLSAPIIAKYGNVKEQYMIAFMILGISSFVLSQVRNKWGYLLLAGGFLSWAPLFKETGFSAVAALGLFVIAQPLLRHKTWKKTGTDILVLFAGALIFLSPLCLWLAAERAPMGLYPYASFWRPVVKLISGSHENQNSVEQQTLVAKPENEENAVQQESKEPGFLLKMMPGYVRDSWMMTDAGVVERRILRWYGVLILPVGLALASIVTRILRILFLRSRDKTKPKVSTYGDRFVFLFAMWWFLDMAFVWVSPRSYEQYFLPLNASAAMLGAYFIAAYSNKVKSTSYKRYWILAGAAGLVLMIATSQHIFFGVKKSPHSGTLYKDTSGNAVKRNGYIQRMRQASDHRHGSRSPWEDLGEYIKDNSTPEDNIYVWGWYPGIYVAAQRFSNTIYPFTSEMHVRSPESLSNMVQEILTQFEKNPPKFIVDSRKLHFPWDRPCLELWPSLSNCLSLFSGLSDAESNQLWSVYVEIFKPTDMKRARFLPADNSSVIKRFEDVYAKRLAKQIGPEEALRFKAMEPLRRYVMENYTIVDSSQYILLSGGRLYHRTFGEHVLFRRKGTLQ